MHKSTTLFNLLTFQPRQRRASYFYVSLFTFCLFTFDASIAQENKTVESKSKKSTKNMIPNAPQSQNDEINFKNETGNSIITITDEGGNTGSISFPNGIAPIDTKNKVYNENGTLMFDGFVLTNNGASSIGGLSDAKTGGASVFLGSNSGTLDDESDNRNTGLGQGALATVTTGRYNVGLGYSALKSLETAEGNIGLGLNSLFSNSIGNYNIGLGQGSQYYLTTGNNNTAIGYRANINNTTGSNNTIIGHEAGAGTASHNKSGNVFLGFNAGYNETSNNKLYIENSISSSPLIWGDFAEDSIKINGGLEVTRKTKTPLLQVTTGATDGFILTSDANGNASWQAASSGSASEINELIDGKTTNSSLYLGATAGEYDDGGSNSNTGLGIGSLSSVSISGTNGQRNSAVGYFSLNDNNSGHSNTANGYYALSSNANGDFNTAIGRSSLGLNTSGERNVAVGAWTNLNNNSGSYNTMIGYEAGRGIGTTGRPVTGNIFIGYQAGGNETTDNKLFIENSNSSSPLIWGDFAIDSIKINGNLNVSGNITTDIIYSVGDYAQGGYVFEVTPDGKHGLVVTLKDQNYSTDNFFLKVQGYSDASWHTVSGANYKDWRSPTLRELWLIYSNKTAIDAMAITYDGIPFDDTNNAYWSSVPSSNNLDYAMYVDMTDGTGHETHKLNQISTRCVRAF